MKKLFLAIHKKDLKSVKEIIEKDPQLVNCVAKQPPKKDDGQSPLQVACKTGHIEIANYLIDMGANVNFMESKDCCNEWRTPILHDAINCAVMCSRWNTNHQNLDSTRILSVYSNPERAEAAYQLLKKIIDKGADINALDSYGNSCLDRYCLQACQILPAFDHSTGEVCDNCEFTKELHEDLKRILILLKESGADITYVSPNTGKALMDFYHPKQIISILLREVFNDK